MVLLTSGYRVTAGKGHHFVTISSLQFTMGEAALPRMKYLNVCRQTRNKTDYDRAGVTEETEVEELLAEVIEFRRDVRDWLSQNHKNLIPNP